MCFPDDGDCNHTGSGEALLVDRDFVIVELQW